MPRLAIVSPFQIAKKPEDAGKKKMEQWTKDKISQFTHTANSQSAIGDDARHGVDRNDPPKEPMPKSEAEALIRNLLKQWLEWKCEQQKQNSKGRHRLRNESLDKE